MHKAMITIGMLTSSTILLAQASPYSNLTGQFTITGKDALDPPPGQKRDRLGLFLTGDSAKRTYNAMTATPINGYACEDGLRLKKAGGLVCASHRGKNYTCSVAIVLATGQTKPIGTC